MTIVRYTISLLERLDQVLAVKITARYFLKPLYQDYSALGYILGFIFRSVRLLAGSLIYSVIILAALAIYILWAGFPIYVIARGFGNI